MITLLRRSGTPVLEDETVPSSLGLGTSADTNYRVRKSPLLDWLATRNKLFLESCNGESQGKKNLNFRVGVLSFCPGGHTGARTEREPPFRVTLSVKPKRLSWFRHSSALPCGEEPLNGTGTWLSCAKACNRNSCKTHRPQNPKSRGS